MLPQPKACLEVNADYTGDACADDFASSEAEFCFADRVPSDPSFHSRNPNDGQIAVLGNDDDEDCAVVLVKETGYYALFDTELSESCADQKDETGYLTVHNSCNGEGWAVERNAGERYLVLDADNEGAGCQADAECGADEVCREGNNHGTCCVPAEPVYMGLIA